ncbi:UDP-glycosyltransferase UGT5 isoform X1 [Drosophila grimshawi]|uniref:UDP-glucuronosyltransferase n=1 Tax=Drosophila grimshawi TaxID=7222 RepID=B4JG71_DROGR|nr:UDP-glycosyltransferase UGT5 isoform X1 [Drosophila grimshawi]EDV93638.1 GH18165 [Drosophila grimshawi]
MNLLHLCLILMACLCHVWGYSYLMISHTAANSHFYVGQALAKGLVAAGHEVTVISPFPQKNPLKNYVDVPTPSSISVMAVHKNKILDIVKIPILFRLPAMHGVGISMTQSLLEEHSVQSLLSQNRTFDAVICEVFMNEAHFGFAEHFNAPLITFSTMGASSWTTDLVGTPSPPSYVPHFLLQFGDHMNFFERAHNLLFILYQGAYEQCVYFPKQEQLYKKYFPNNKQNFYDMRKNTALVLLNNHVSLGFPRPYAPNMIEVGGMHINRKRQQLPQNIEDFINGAQHGVIYFSLGSNLKSSALPLEMREALVETLRNLKQRVLWKFEEPNLPGKPDNVFISDWFPQDDILAHEKVILFITHGGLLSTTESIYHGKPVLGIPFFGDQFMNMARAQQSGYGLTLRFTELTAETFKNSINKLLSDPSYTQKVHDMSVRFRDQHETPLERAVYWVEHVTRQKGARYLRSASQDLNFIQYYNLDVLIMIIGGLGFVIFTFIYLLMALIKVIAKKIGGKRKKAKRN